MPFQHKADRSGAPVKIMVDGPSGSGKTYTALEIATGLVEDTGRPIGLIDSQNGQSSRYADLFDFYPEIIRDYSPKTYVDMIHAAEAAKLGVLILDSVTHEWTHCLEMVDAISRRTGSANNGWREVTPSHKRFVEAIIQATIPLIVTVRTKTDWLYSEEQRGGRKVIVPHKMGTKPEQRDQFEFEFDLWLRMDRSHKAAVEKSVFSFIETDTEIGVPTREIGRSIRRWFEGTSFDAEAVLAERRQAASAEQPRSTPAPATNGRATGPSDPLSAETSPRRAQADDDVTHDHEPDEDGADTEAAEDDGAEDDDSARVGLYARYRTLAAVAVMSRHKQGMTYAGANLDDLTDAELLAQIDKLEQHYPNVHKTGSYQCDVCGKRIYPHVIEEYQGHSFPGLQLIAIGVRDFKRALCAEHLAVERQKHKRRAAGAASR